MHPVEFLQCNDRLVSAINSQTIYLTEIVDLLLLQKVGSELLVILQYACIERVLEYLADVGFVPPGLAHSSEYTLFFKLELYLSDAHTVQIPVVYLPHRLSLLGINNKFFPDPVVPEYISVAVIHAVLHRSLLSTFHTDRSLSALVLCKGSHYGQTELAVTVKCPDVVVDEEHLHTQPFQVTGVLQSVHRVSCET